ncbi:MAG: AAA family ATPase [Pseudomonadota bacterium]
MLIDMTPIDHRPAALAHVRWIAGGSGAGKSTLARRLAARHDAALYDTDAVMRDHASRCAPDQCPRLSAFMRMSLDERWVRRTPQEMLDTFHWFAGEGFDLILSDVLAFPRDRPVIAEGFRLLPRLVAPLLTDRRHAVWMLPSPAFRRSAFDMRGTTWDMPRRTGNPAAALANLLARDALFTDRLRQEAATLALHMVDVDETQDEGALLACLSHRFFG